MPYSPSTYSPHYACHYLKSMCLVVPSLSFAIRTLRVSMLTTPDTKLEVNPKPLYGLMRLSTLGPNLHPEVHTDTANTIPNSTKGWAQSWAVREPPSPPEQKILETSGYEILYS